MMFIFVLKVHLILSLLTIGVYTVGGIAMSRSTKLLGYSFGDNAFLHRFCGWLTVLLFALILLMPSLRPVANSPFRKIIMIAHALLGIFYYIFGSKLF